MDLVADIEPIQDISFGHREVAGFRETGGQDVSMTRPGDKIRVITFGEAALKHGRDVTLVDVSEEAVGVMRRRLAAYLGP